MILQYYYFIYLSTISLSIDSFFTLLKILEILEEEKEAHNYLITLNDVPIGHIRYRFIDNKYKVERFCILKEYRGKGYGRKTFQYFIDYLGAQFNPCIICLDGQFYLKDFYESFGCITIGEPFMEAGIKHVYLEKKY